MLQIVRLSHLVGEALCYQLSKCGAKLILSARSVEKLETLRQKLTSPENARYHVASVYIYVKSMALASNTILVVLCMHLRDYNTNCTKICYM